MIDTPMSFTRYRRDRLMEIWDESGVAMSEVREAYPAMMMRFEWEEMLDRCAERGVIFPRQLLQALPVQFQIGINRRSKGASMPERYVIPRNAPEVAAQ